MNMQIIKKIHGGGIFVAATFIAQVFNFLYNAYLGRALAFEDYALITIVINIWYFILLVLNALSFAITNRIAALSKEHNDESLGSYYRFFHTQTFQISLASAVLWIFITPVLKHFFHIQDWYALIMIAPLIVVGGLLNINRGYLQGRLYFIQLSTTLVFESLLRLVAAYVIIESGYPQWAYASIPISLIVSYYLSVLLTRPHVPDVKNVATYQFPRALFTALLLIGLSTTVFLTIDILLVKHYFEDRIAGMYALLALVRKIIFFFSSLLTTILFTYASKGEAKSHTLFNRILAATVALSGISFILFGIYGSFTTELMLGIKARTIVPYLLPYAAGMSLFAITNLFITYYIARGNKKVALISLFMAGGLVCAIVTYHQNLFQIVYSLLAVSIGGAVGVLAVHFSIKGQSPD